MEKHDRPKFDVIIINQENQGTGYDWLANDTNAKISDGQALKHQFCRRMYRSHFAKSNQDQNVAQRCRDGENNIYSCYRKVETYPYVCRKQCLHHSDVSAFRRVHHFSCCVDEMPYFDCFTKSVLFRYDTQGFYVVYVYLTQPIRNVW